MPLILYLLNLNPVNSIHRGFLTLTSISSSPEPTVVYLGRAVFPRLPGDSTPKLNELQALVVKVEVSSVNAAVTAFELNFSSYIRAYVVATLPTLTDCSD